MLNFSEFRRIPDRLSDVLPWAALVAPGVVLNKDGSLQATIQYRGPDLASSTESELIVSSAHVNNILRRLGTGWCLYSEAQREEVSEYPKCDWPNELSEAIDRERKQSYQNLKRYESKYFITLTYLAPAEATTKVVNVFIEQQDTKQAGYDYHKVLEHFQAEITRIADLLARVFPEARKLNDEETLTYLHSVISANRHRVMPPEIPMYLDSFLCDSPLIGGFEPKLGNKYLSVLSVLGFPTASFPGILDQLNVLSIPYRWSTRFIFLDKYHAKKELEDYKRKWFAKRKGITTLIKEMLTKEESALDDSEAVQKAQIVDNALIELGTGQITFGYFTTTIVISDENKELLQSKTSEIERVINGLGFVIRRENVNAVDAWLGTIPGNSRNNVRRPLLHTLNLAHMIPGGSALWEGMAWNSHLQGPPLVVAATDGSTPFKLSLHVGDVGHTMILGPTGAGKSTLLNLLEVQFLKYKDAQVYIFDKGHSALPLTLAVGGDHYDLGSKECSLTFQPLGLIDDPSELQWAQDFILSIIERENVTITPDVKGHVWNALQALSNSPSEHRTIYSLSVFLQHLEIRQALKPFTVDGTYGAMIDNTNDNLNAGSWACFEMGTLMETPALVPIVLAYLFHRLEQKFTGAPTLLVLDEAWLFLDHPTFASKIREWLKTLRKKNVSVVFATQSLADIDKASIAPTLKEACFTKIYLPNSIALQPDATQFYKSFGLNEKQIQILAEAMPKQDYYYTSPRGNRLFNLALGPTALAYCGAGTPRNLALAQELRRTTNSTEEFNSEYMRAVGLKPITEKERILKEAA